MNSVLWLWPAGWAALLAAYVYSSAYEVLVEFAPVREAFVSDWRITPRGAAVMLALAPLYGFSLVYWALHGLVERLDDALESLLG
jgi:hypothetical protein